MEEHPAAGGVAVAPPGAYAVIVEWAGTNYSAYLPDVPGCVTTGATVEETVANMREALALYIEVARETGQAVPPPAARVATIEAVAEDAA